MSRRKVKTKEKLDMNPMRVQDPKIFLKRSPGKFDQRANKEQELKSLNSNKFYDRISALQQKQTLGQLNQKIVDLKSKQKGLKAQCGEYSYLRKLRLALDEEKAKREALSLERRFLYHDVESVRRANTVQSNRLNQSAERLPPVSKTALITQLHHLNTENQTELPQLINQSTFFNGDNNQSHPHTIGSQLNQLVAEIPLSSGSNFDNNLLSTNSDNHLNDFVVQNNPSNSAENNESEDGFDVGDELISDSFKEKIIQKTEVITPTRTAMLESLAYEIMTRTLPIKKLKRILPDEKPPVTQRYPIMSSHRKTNIIPHVKSQQRHLEQDMVGLKDRISSYFGEDFPLCLYKYKPDEKPRKVQILKAISHEKIKLPELPKQ